MVSGVEGVEASGPMRQGYDSPLEAERAESHKFNPGSIQGSKASGWGRSVSVTMAT